MGHKNSSTKNSFGQDGLMASFCDDITMINIATNSIHHNEATVMVNV